VLEMAASYGPKPTLVLSEPIAKRGSEVADSYYQKLIAELDDEIARLMHTLPNATEHPAPIPKRTKRTAYQRMGNDPLFDLRSELYFLVRAADDAVGHDHGVSLMLPKEGLGLLADNRIVAYIDVWGEPAFEHIGRSGVLRKFAPQDSPVKGDRENGEAVLPLD
jgi:hypothetical protein